MPKYYCDYCDTYLTHDSPSVRKTHCAGRKHKENVKFYYQKWMEEQAQSLIDATTAAFKAGKLPGGMPPGPGGVAIPPPMGMRPPPGKKFGYPLKFRFLNFVFILKTFRTSHCTGLLFGCTCRISDRL